MKSLVRDIVEQITVAADRIEIRLSRAKIAAALEAGESQRSDLDPVVLSIEAKLRCAGKGKRLVIENCAGAEVNAGLAAMIAEAFVIRKQLLSGSDASIEAMTEPRHQRRQAWNGHGAFRNRSTVVTGETITDPKGRSIRYVET